MSSTISGFPIASSAPGPVFSRPSSATPSTGTGEASQVQTYRPAAELNQSTAGLSSHPERSAAVTESQAQAANQITRSQLGEGNGPEYAAGMGTLDHNRRVCDPTLDQQTVRDANGQWNGQRILSNLGQLDNTGRAESQEVRCAASALLSGAVMRGPEATATYAERLSSQVSDPRQQQELFDIRGRVLDGSATNGDMHRLQELTYQRYNTDGSTGLNAAELSAAQRDLATGVTVDPTGQTTTAAGARVTPGPGRTVEQAGRTSERIAGLQNGESFTLAVNTAQNGQGVNHAVSVGRDASGRSYVYDPYPRSNQPNVIYQDENPQAFNHYTGGNMGADFNGVRANVIYGGTVNF